MKCAECDSTILAVDCDVDPQRLAQRLRAQCGHKVSREVALALWRAGMRWTLPVVDGASLGAAERHRQVHEEGYTAAHDADLSANDLTWAAWCLLDAAASESPVTDTPAMWPEAMGEWKPDHTPMRRRVIAMALIAAEIDKTLVADRAS